MKHSHTLVLGTRGSALALWQARHVGALLRTAGISVQIVEVRTTGDRITDVPLAEIGDKGLFTRELDVALLKGEIDLAVHSLKDLPTQLPDGITLAAVSEREEPWDAFVAHPSFIGRLDDLPEGATIATSSLRRQAQLLAWRPDLEVVPVRGNVDTRLRKLDESAWHGMILAAAGLRRLNMDSRIRQVVPASIMLPAVGQGALGIVCAQENEELRQQLHDALDDTDTRVAVTSERAFLRRLEGGCQVPIGAYASVQSGRLSVEGMVASLDGRMLVRDRIGGNPENAASLGNELAERLLKKGAADILRDIRSK